MHTLLLALQLSIATPDSFERLRAQGRSELVAAKYEEANRTLRTAVQEAEIVGASPTALAIVINDLAEVCRRLGNYAAAESLYERALALLKDQPKSSLVQVVVLGNQGTMYRDLGLESRSVVSFEKAMAMAKKAHFEKDPQFAAILNGLAAANISARGDLTRAKRYLEEALRIREAALGPNHLDVAETLNNLGTVLYKAKDYAKAEAVLKRAFAITEKELGADHPDLAVTLSNLGVLYLDRHDLAEAEKSLRRALQIRRQNLPPTHLMIASSLLNLAQVLIQTDLHEEAQQLLQQAVAIRNQYPHNLTAESVLTMEQYALALRLNGRVSDAEAAEARARSMRTELSYVVRAYRYK